ncbi:MAG: oligosaccharide flippase family protein [Saprospiraceae bacterium]|nr:oligosaccharide flippase family protein [Saprospiraceae bacterium]
MYECVSLCNVFLDSGISTSIIRSGLIYDNEYSTIFFYNIFQVLLLQVFYILCHHLLHHISMYLLCQLLSSYYA